MNKTLKSAVEKAGPALIAVNIGVSVATIYNWISGRSEPDRRSQAKLEELGIEWRNGK